MSLGGAVTGKAIFGHESACHGQWEMGSETLGIIAMFVFTERNNILSPCYTMAP